MGGCLNTSTAGEFTKNLKLIKIKYMKKIQILIAVCVAVVLVVAGLVYYIGFYHGHLSKDQATAKAMDYINHNIQAGYTAQLLDSSDMGSVYQIHLKIDTTEYYSYITKDGKYLFPTGIDLSAAPTATDTQQEASSTVDAGTAPSDLAAFAQCVADSGAKFYGAFWCSHCQSQKAMFGDAADKLPYVECSTPDGKGQLQVCTDKNITGYPTWVFADGSRQSGELSFQTLSDKTGCPIQ